MCYMYTVQQMEKDDYMAKLITVKSSVVYSITGYGEVSSGFMMVTT